MLHTEVSQQVARAWNMHHGDIWQTKDYIEKFYLEPSYAHPLFADISHVGWAQKLRANLESIRTELANFGGEQEQRVRDIDATQSTIDVGEKMWSMIPLRTVAGTRRDFARRFPRTLHLIPRNCINAFFSTLAPGKSIPFHEGIYSGVWRYHIVITPADNVHISFPVDAVPTFLPAHASVTEYDGSLEYTGFTRPRTVPTSEYKFLIHIPWDTEGVDFAFDDTCLHSVVNESRTARTILVIDFPKTFVDRTVDMLNTEFISSILRHDHSIDGP